jgi:hypothetical protein
MSMEAVTTSEIEGEMLDRASVQSSMLRNRLIARIVPAGKNKKSVKLPDFEARRKKIFGDRILPGADIVIEERGRY